MSLVEISITLLLGGALFIFYLIYRFCYAPYQLFKKCGIKGPTPAGFTGNYYDIKDKNVRERNEFLCNKYGPVTGYYLGCRPRIVITDLDMLKQILVKDFDNFTDRTPFPNLVSETDSLITSKGEKWKFVRRTLTPSFSASKLKMMLPLLKESTDNLVAILGEKAKSGESFNASKISSQFTTECILATAFGRHVNVLRGETSKLSKQIDIIIGGLTDGQVEGMIVLESHFPWLFKSRLTKYLLSCTEGGKAVAYVRNVTLDLIRIRRESGHGNKCKDILQLMIEASGEEGGSDETEPPTECPAHKTTVAARGVMTDNEVAENSMLFLLAGLDTTASLISYSCYQLALHPDIQEKLQSEIDTYFEDKQESNLYAAAQEIDYLDNVIQEILRLHPPAPEIDRYCKQTTVISGVTIPEGVTVTVPIALLHYSPLYWKDPEKFDPDRFTAEEKATRPQLCHMPFGFGPRSCIGMRLALLEAKIALIELLKRYTFTRAPETEVPLLEVGVVLKPKNGVYLKVIERSQL